jgi:hypothetical protein
MGATVDIWTVLFAVGCCLVVARAFDSLGAMIPGSSWGGLYVTAGRAVALLDDSRRPAAEEGRPTAVDGRGRADPGVAAAAVIEDVGGAPTPAQPVGSWTLRWRG